MNSATENTRISQSLAPRRTRRHTHLQESTWKCDDEFVGSLDETILDIDPVCHELILGSDDSLVSLNGTKHRGEQAPTR